MFQKRVWVKIGVLIAAVVMLCGCPGAKRGEMKNAKNTPIVVSGGSITGHTHHTRDWTCTSGASQSCTALAYIDPHYQSLAVVVTSANLIDSNNNPLNQAIGSNWSVVVAGSDDGDPSHNPSLTIQPTTNCQPMPSSNEVCVSFAISNSSAYFGQADANESLGRGHRERSLWNSNGPHGYHIQSVTVSSNGQSATGQCKDPNANQKHGCLVCIAESSDNTPCKWDDQE